MIRITNIKLAVNEEQGSIKHKIAKKLRLDNSDVLGYKIFKQSLDARKKDRIFFIYTVDVEVKNEKKILHLIKDKDVSLSPVFEYNFPEGLVAMEKRPIIIGFGPAGIFAAIHMVEMGLKPIILERGEGVDERKETVEKFWSEGKLNTESNVQFGEGGAGTFSDGKLTTRIKDLRCRKVLEEMVEAGAPDEILYSYKPHIGTDKLRVVVKNLREKITKLGGEVRFNSKVTDIIINNNAVEGVIVNGTEKIESNNIVLAVGHSARDTFELLNDRNFDIEQKPFAMGVRIEHLQRDINKAQFGDEFENENLGKADYKLTHTSKDGRSVYTFCMCPGGEVVAASSEEGMLSTNGMSVYARDNDNANSAILVQIFPHDFGSNHPLAGMYFQRNIERKAFEAGGSNYNAPAQLVEDFLNKKDSSQIDGIKNTYRPGIKLSNIDNVLPDFMADAIREAIPAMGKRLKGFDRADSLLTAVESRSSSPIRIMRNDATGESTNIKGIYPTGEGAGYAGGIISAAVDGIASAENIFNNNKIN